MWAYIYAVVEEEADFADAAADVEVARWAVGDARSALGNEGDFFVRQVYCVSEHRVRAEQAKGIVHVCIRFALRE